MSLFTELNNKFSKIALVFTVIAGLQCSQMSEAPRESVEQDDYQEGESSNAPRNASKLSATKDETQNSFANYLSEYRINNPDFERLLEYNVTLSYESTNFGESRNALYDLAAKFGFLQSVQNHYTSNRQMQSNLYIKSDALPDFLKSAQKLGKLKLEQIEAKDLTLQNFETLLKLSREKVRSIRRRTALTGAASAVNYTERERLLSESEDKEDEAKKNEWLIKDRVKWAKVNVLIDDPYREPGITVPDFKRIVFDLVTFVLYVLFLGLYLAPVALAVWGVWLFFKRIRRKK